MTLQTLPLSPETSAVDSNNILRGSLKELYVLESRDFWGEGGLSFLAGPSKGDWDLLLDWSFLGKGEVEGPGPCPSASLDREPSPVGFLHTRLKNITLHLGTEAITKTKSCFELQVGNRNKRNHSIIKFSHKKERPFSRRPNPHLSREEGPIP